MTLLDQYGNTLRKTRGRIQARYDAAHSGLDNARHWEMADSLSAVTANSHDVRSRLRDRSRYEIANNSYLRGGIDTLANWTIGTGPRIQTEASVEVAFNEWLDARGLPRKLSTMCQALDGDGEAFALFATSPTPTLSGLELDIRLYEADQFASSSWGGEVEEADAGIRLLNGEPNEYAMLRSHPGGGGFYSGLEVDWIPSERVLHLFRANRPGQLRGIPKTTPALGLFAQIRRYILATITAAETAADFAGILYQDAAPDDGDILEPWDRLEIERGALLTAPNNSKITQLRAEHPITTFDEFVKSLLREAARALGLPAVLMLGDASGFNFSSAKMDLLSFQQNIEVERRTIWEPMLSRIFGEWLREARLLGGLPEDFDGSHSWRWPSYPVIDRGKEAEGQAKELENNTTTLAREYAKKGQDWEVELRQRAKELTLLKELGLDNHATDYIDSSQGQDL